jgi:hypothetical protein
MFVVGGLATGVGSYYDGATPRSPWVSAAIGIGCGIILVVLGRKQIAAVSDGRSPEIVLRPFSVFSTLVALAGLVICIWGVSVENWGLAVSGVPLLALGLGLIAARWWVRARAGSRRDASASS